MTRILSGTAAVLNGDRTVAFTGPPLSDANCPADGAVVLGGAAYFIASRTDTASFELTRDYEGADATVTCEIDPLNAAAINIARVARSITDYDAKLALLDANGKGLFYSLIGVTGAGDPGPGNMAFDNANMTLVSELYLDVLDANAGGLDVAALIDLWQPGTVLIVRSLASSAYAAFRIVQAPIDAGGFRRLMVAPIGSDGVLAAELVAVEWRLAGAAKDVDDYAPDVPGLDAFAAEDDGFIVLVADAGDGRTARYRRDRAAAGGWVLVGYWTGPSITLAITEVDDVPYGAPPDVTLTSRAGGYDMTFAVPLGMIIEPGTITTLAPDQPAAWSWEPIEGGYRVHLAIPRGPTGDITGVTPFWNTRLGSDADAAAARIGLGAADASKTVQFDAQTKTPAEQGQARANIGADDLSGYRNKIMNGDFDCWQRASSQNTAGYGSADRWSLSLGSVATCSLTRQTHALGQTDVPGNPRYYLSFARSVVGTSTSYISEKIESVRTLAGRKATLTFYAKAAAATDLNAQYNQNFGTGGAPSAVVAASISTFTVTTAWQKFTIAFDLPSITGKTLGSNGDDNLEISLRRNVASANPTTTIDISRISLVAGDATAETDPFSPRSVGQELSLCQRYYSETPVFDIIAVVAANHYATCTAVAPVTMRATPSASLVSAGAGANANVGTVSIDNLLPGGGRVYALSLAGGTAAFGVIARFSAEL